MPRCCSSAIQSEVAWRAALRPLTVPAIWIAPPNSSSFSVSVVLPASGCEMMAKVRRRAISCRRESSVGPVIANGAAILAGWQQTRATSSSSAQPRPRARPPPGNSRAARRPARTRATGRGGWRACCWGRTSRNGLRHAGRAAALEQQRSSCRPMPRQRNSGRTQRLRMWASPAPIADHAVGR